MGALNLHREHWSELDVKEQVGAIRFRIVVCRFQAEFLGQPVTLADIAANKFDGRLNPWRGERHAML